MSPGETWWQRFRHHLSVLDAAQKPGHGVPAYTRWVNRRGARVVAAAGAAGGLTPNQITAISMLFSVCGMAVLIACPPAPWVGLLTAVLLALGYLFDSADGQLARLTGTSSKTGEWIDHVADAFRSPAIHVAVAVAVVIYRGDDRWLAVVALIYSLVTSGQFLSQILAEAFVTGAGRTQRRGGTMRSFVLLPTDPGVLCWWFVFWGIAPVFALGYTALAVVACLHSTVSLSRRYQDLRALDAAQSRQAGQADA